MFLYLDFGSAFSAFLSECHFAPLIFIQNAPAPVTSCVPTGPYLSALGKVDSTATKKLIINGPTSVQHQSGTFSFAGYLFAHLNKSKSIAAGAK